MGEQFCLKWNDFQSTISQSFKELQAEKDFVNVTLVSDDEVQFQAHKVVLSASSPFFKNVLKKSPHEHPLIYLNGVSSTSIKYILDYVYQGKVDIYQDQLDSFLDTASKLKIFGLTEAPESTEMKNEKTTDIIEDSTNFMMKESRSLEPMATNTRRNFAEKTVVSCLDNDGGDTDIEQLLLKISEMTEKVDGVYTCKVCGKAAKDKTNLGKHIETHIEGLSFSCKMCQKVFRSRDVLRKHNGKCK